MGRLIDIARKTNGALLPSVPPPVPLRKDSPHKILPLVPPAFAKPPRGLPTAEVINIIVLAARPVSHSAILKVLMERGHARASARQAIAWCQQERHIEHDLVAGYVLP